MAQRTVPRSATGEGIGAEAKTSHLFTSESVTEGHPDKIADQISDTILDAALESDPKARVACETMCTTGLVVVAGEITTDTYVDIPSLVRQKVSEIGYTRAKFGFDAETCGVIVSIDPQSSDIARPRVDAAPDGGAEGRRPSLSEARRQEPGDGALRRRPPGGHRYGAHKHPAPGRGGGSDRR